MRDVLFHRFELSFWELSRRMERLWDGVFAETFPSSQSQIVYMLFQDGELRMSEIAGRLDLTAGSVTTAAGHLIDGGYVERVLSDEDRRVILLRLMDSVLDWLRELEVIGQEKVRKVFGHVDDALMDELNDVFMTAIDCVKYLEDSL